MRSLLKKTAAFVLAMIVAAYGLSGCKPPAKKGDGAGEKRAAGDVAEKVKVDFYIMSQCPFGTQVQKGIKPVLDKMGPYVDFKQDFIASELGAGKFKSLHGEAEVQGNIAQMCMEKYYPENHKYMDAVLCMAEDMKGIPGNWKDCATKHGLDAAKIGACFEGEEGKQLMTESLKRAEAVKAGGSPTIYIAGEKYSGGRTDKDFETAICCAFAPENKPGACAADLKCPKRVPIDLTVLSDKRCKECGQRVEMMIRNFQDRFPKLTVNKLDYGTPEGKDLFEKTKVGKLPAYLFDQNLKEDSGYSQVQRWLRPAGDYLVMMTGAKFDPTQEICDNGEDDTGNGQVDCDDESCKGTLECREEKANTVDLFVMSECPFGVKAVDAMDEVLKNFGANLTFNLRFLVDVMSEEEWSKLPKMRQTRCVKKADDQFYCSLHGEGELNEDIRQACAAKYYPKNYKYMDYILCRNKNLKNPEWQGCAKEAGLDVPKITKCFEGQEGLDLIQADAKFANEVDFSGSPSFLSNNKKKMVIRDRSPDGIKTAICGDNKDLAGCEKELTKEQPGGGGKKPPSGSCG